MALTKISGNVVQQNNFSLSGVVTATSFTGDLTGNVTGNVTGTATTATNLADGANITTGTISNDRLPATITKNLTGDVTGNLTGNVTGTATTATNLADGANITTGTISNDRLPATITKNLTGDVTGNLTGNVSSSGANTLGSLTVTNDATVGGALTVTGNLTVNGTTTTIDTVVTAIDSLAVDGDVTAGGNLDITGVSTFKGTTEVKNASFKVTNSSASGQYLQVTQNSNSSLNLDKVGDGAFYIRGNNIYLQNDGTSETYAGFEANGKSYLNYDGSTKLETTGTGVTITGDARVTGILTVGQSSVTIDGTNNKITTPKLDYAGISSSIADTAVDVFVYDTRKDSDGGAWRKRTQHTSWYNETLNTSIRGSRREFPAVAVIVLISNYVIIYDGDDPDLPMWMKIKRNSGAETYWYGFGSAFPTATSIYAMNGIIAATHTDNNNSSGGVALIRFIHDNFYRYGINNGNGGTSTINISERESSTSFPDTPTGTLVSWKANDVAMTVLPNAPIDDATGLPVPTIAVATEGGTSIIKDDGSVVDLTNSQSGYENCDFVDLVGDEVLLSFETPSVSQNARRFWIHSIPSSDTTVTSTVIAQGSADEFYKDYNPSFSGNALNYHLYPDYKTTNNVLLTSNDFYLGLEENLAIINRNKNSDGGKDGMLCGIATSFNTGWMHGNCKGAFLSDTDATNVSGSELIPNPGNGNFTATTNWQAKPNGGTVSVSGGNLVVSTSGNYQGCEVTPANLPTLVSGTRYIMSIDVASVSAGTFRFGVVSGAVYSSVSGAGVYSVDFTSNGNVEEIFIDSGTYGSAATIQLNSVNLREAERDRSVNDNGLQVFGTITKSAVATGAELVAYSGWNNSNYFEQPYNSVMQFGSTNDFSISFWMKQTSPAASGFGGIIDNGYGSSSAKYFLVGTDTNGKAFFRVSGGSGLENNLTGLITVTGGQWRHIVCVRESSGTITRIYVDGILDNSLTGTARDVSNTDNHQLTVGDRSNSTDRYFTGSLALLRVSASAPSAEQVKKMYEDEKVLFQENAACTLYGSSDAVTALAYDDSTNLLYAGTSSGRSDFQGLRRINNTTTAVTTAMSASNGLVAEQ